MRAKSIRESFQFDRNCTEEIRCLTQIGECRYHPCGQVYRASVLCAKYFVQLDDFARGADRSTEWLWKKILF